jgi:hypothetical protein
MFGRLSALTLLLCTQLCLLLGASACSGTLAFGPEVPRPEERKRRVVKPQPAPEPVLQIGGTDGDDGAGRSREPLRLNWTQQTRPFNQAVAIAASGQVAVLSSNSLALLDHKTGAVLARRDVCPTFEHAIGFVDETTLALVCEDRVKLLLLPGLSDRGMRALPRKAMAVRFAGRRAAIAFTSGPVGLFDTDSWKQIHEVPVSEPVSALALTRDGSRMAVGLASGDVVLAGPDIAAERITVKRALEVSSLDFSPDGSQLFASSGPLAGVWPSDGAAMLQRFSVNGAYAARWVGPAAIASVGRDGLLLLSLEQGGVRSIDGGWGGSTSTRIGLAVSADGERLSSADRAGRLTCFSRSRAAAARATPSSENRLLAGSESMSGEVAALERRRLKVTAQPRDPLPEASREVVVLRYTERTVAAVRQARWREAGRAQVVKVVGDLVHLRLADTPATGPAAEAAREPFAVGEPLRLLW